MRDGEAFLQSRGLYLADLGFEPDPGRATYADGDLVFYHYTRAEQLEAIMQPDSGLDAGGRMPCDGMTPEFEGLRKVDVLFDPLPLWMTDSPQFGDFALGVFIAAVGDVLLRVQLPRDWPGLYVVENAFFIDTYHATKRGNSRLSLGYTSETGKDCWPAMIHSIVPLDAYCGGHLCPNVLVARQGSGIVIPSEYLSVAAVQPLAERKKQRQELA